MVLGDDGSGRPPTPEACLFLYVPRRRRGRLLEVEGFGTPRLVARSIGEGLRVDDLRHRLGDFPVLERVGVYLLSMQGSEVALSYRWTGSHAKASVGMRRRSATYVGEVRRTELRPGMVVEFALGPCPEGTPEVHRELSRYARRRAPQAFLDPINSPRHDTDPLPAPSKPVAGSPPSPPTGHRLTFPPPTPRPAASHPFPCRYSEATWPARVVESPPGGEVAEETCRSAIPESVGGPEDEAQPDRAEPLPRFEPRGWRLRGIEWRDRGAHLLRDARHLIRGLPLTIASAYLALLDEVASHLVRRHSPRAESIPITMVMATMTTTLSFAVILVALRFVRHYLGFIGTFLGR